MQKELFAYDFSNPDGRDISTRPDDGVAHRLFSYAIPFGYRRVGHIIRPASGDPCPAILFVHWYEPESPDSNRTQFESEAIALAKRGVTSLLVETMWSDRDWFFKRTQRDDYAGSVQQVVELRCAMDLLLKEPGVDPNRIAYVGHDFGAMYGTVLGSVDARAACYVLMAGTPHFPDWFLYYPKLAGAERAQFIAMMQPLDPVSHIGNLSPAPVLFQFATDDPHVSQERAVEFYNAAREPKELRWYEAGHGLNDTAKQERVAWLAKQLGV